MEDLVKYLLYKVPTLTCLNYVATLIDGSVLLEGENVGIDDSCEGGYIRYNGDATFEDKQIASCQVNTQETRPYTLVVWHKNKNIISYADMIVGVLSERRFKTKVTGLNIDKRKILLSESKNEETNNDELKLILINFDLTRKLSPAECLTIEC